MRETDFTAASPGRLVAADTLDGRYWPAFVPNSLPPSIEWSGDTVALLSGADRALSELNGRAAALPNPYLLIRPLSTREAVASSGIEGTTSTIAELYQYQLVDAGILTQVERSGPTQVYVAQGILNAIAEEPDFRDF